MSINSEYNKYCHSGGTLTKQEYTIHLHLVKTAMGDLINHDPEDMHSDIGRRIFSNLDLSSAVAFSQVSRGLYERSRNRWFVPKVREIVLKYVQKGTDYSDYLKNDGWQDFAVLGVKLVGVTLTVSAGVKAGIHASRIPPDAPKKRIIETNSDGNKRERTIIDHPEARKAEMWTCISVLSGTITTAGIVGHGMYTLLLEDIDLNYFFSNVEKDILSGATTNIGLKILSPGFHKWKMTQMKQNLTSNPPNWQAHPILSQMICPISGDFILFPVKDKCGHYFDYRSVRAYQLDRNNLTPLQCPVSSKKPNTGLATLTFDKTRFDSIQRIIHQ